MISVTSYIEQLTVKRQQRGLTLIELVFVVAILAILAGFLVPRLGFVRNLAIDSAQASQTSAAAEHAVFYNVVNNKFGDGWDTLLNASDTVYANGTIGYLNKSLQGYITPLDLTNNLNAAKSLLGQLNGQLDPITSVTLYDHDATNNANSSGTIPTVFTYTKGSPDSVASTGGKSVAQITLPTSTASPTYPIYQAIYGASKLTAAGIPADGTYLVALGFGANSAPVGKTVLQAPIIATKDTAEYGRPLLLLKVFAGQAGAGVTVDATLTGKNATTVGALTPLGQAVNTVLDTYKTETKR